MVRGSEPAALRVRYPRRQLVCSSDAQRVAMTHGQRIMARKLATISRSCMVLVPFGFCEWFCGVILLKVCDVEVVSLHVWAAVG